MSPDSTPPAPETSPDDFILKQAMLAGALELLPEKLANVAILPVQMRMVYQIGKRHGQELNLDQVKDLGATLGFGMGAQALEGVVRQALGGLAGGILGGLVGSATGLAAGAAVTFASTYALGHVAQQYYAQGRKLSADDLKALFARFQQEAKDLFPKVEEKIKTEAKTLDLQRLLASES
jgi:uncharacterized protein (DUF697 family)